MNSPEVRRCRLFGLALGVAMTTVSAAETGRDARRGEIVEAAAASAEKLWLRIGESAPEPSLSSRALFSAALAECEARRHPGRLARLFALADGMQDQDPASRHYGNFRWYWRDEAVTDPNAVEFCAYDMHLVWRLHRDWLPDAARASLRAMLDRAVDGCLRHRVRPSYTNIAVLNAANLITLGEMLGRDDAAIEGALRLEGLAADIWQFGLHEYCSPTYLSVDVQGLAVIERFAEREPVRRLARALLELVWTDIAVNFLPAAERLAGPHSRSYDYLRGLGGLQQDLRWEGWSDVPPSKSTEVLHVAQGRWSPPEGLLDLAKRQFPRLVRQSWGPRPEQSRTHWLLADVTLGCAGALYGSHDCPLTFDLPGRPGAVRGFFIPDGREDPYGRRKFGTGAAKHQKALHLEPFWAGAQREADAVGLVVYRDADLAAPETTNLQSHLVMPRDIDGLWIGRTRIPPIGAKTTSPSRFRVDVGEAVVIRKGSAAVGLRIVWSRAQDGQVAEAALVADEEGMAVAAMRLTIEHRRGGPRDPAGAALWVRVGGGLATDQAFERWRADFERSKASRVEITAERLHVAVPGRDGPVAITAESPFGDAAVVSLEPAPSRAVLELDGIEVGRPLLEQTEPCRSFAVATAGDRFVEVPSAGGVRLEAESGLVLPRMALADDGDGTRFAWQPDEPMPAVTSGSVSWKIRVPHAGRCWLWARVLAPDGKRDSFTVSIAGPDGRPLRDGAWHVPRSSKWRWSPIVLDASRDADGFELPSGDVRLTVLPREPGTRIHAVWVSRDRRVTPEGP